MELSAVPAAALPVADLKAQLPAGRRGDDPAQVKKVAQQFEAMFLGMMLKSMRETVKEDKLTGGGHGEETFRSLLDQEYAQAAVQSGGIGLAAFIEKELSRGSGNGSATPAGPAPGKGVKETGNAD